MFASARLAALLGVSAPLLGHALRTSKTWGAGGVRELSFQDPHPYSFHDFVADFSRGYEEGSSEWGMRKELFDDRLKEIMEFNAVPGRSWNKGVTRFMDYTEPERKRMLGYTGLGFRKDGGSDAPPEASMLRTAPKMPTAYSVQRSGTKLVHLVRDQGNCGSCWAEAATSTLEGQMEANATLMAALASMHAKSSKVPQAPTLSSQAVVSCTPNQRHCGGTGGCGGATVELAYEMVKSRGGLPFAMEWSYESGRSGSTPKCKKELFPAAQVSITGHVTLPVNKLAPLKEALVQTGGPIAVSVDASHWFAYTSGIFSDKDAGFGQGDFTVNHAVTLMGYRDPEKGAQGYWVIKNSWGKYWGEFGEIRLEMKPNEEEHCGWDRSTHDGLACDGDPDKAWVCGTCGVLYDSAYPTGVHLRTA